MSKEKLLKLKLKNEKIKVDGETYEIREMSGEDASEYESSIFKMVNGKPVYDTKNAKAKLVALTLYQDGEKVFENNDLGLINQLPASVINNFFNLSARVNMLDVEENVKNS